MAQILQEVSQSSEPDPRSASASNKHIPASASVLTLATKIFPDTDYQTFHTFLLELSIIKCGHKQSFLMITTNKQCRLHLIKQIFSDHVNFRSPRLKKQPHHGFKDDGPSSKDLHRRPPKQRQQVRHRGRRRQDRPRHRSMGCSEAARICFR